MKIARRTALAESPIQFRLSGYKLAKLLKANLFAAAAAAATHLFCLRLLFKGLYALAECPVGCGNQKHDEHHCKDVVRQYLDSMKRVENILMVGSSGARDRQNTYLWSEKDTADKHTVPVKLTSSKKMNKTSRALYEHVFER